MSRGKLQELFDVVPREQRGTAHLSVQILFLSCPIAPFIFAIYVCVYVD